MTDLMVDVPDMCPAPGCTKSFGHELDPEDQDHGSGMYAKMEHWEVMYDITTHTGYVNRDRSTGIGTLDEETATSLFNTWASDEAFSNVRLIKVEKTIIKKE
jgi:hypothetical protein